MIENTPETDDESKAREVVRCGNPKCRLNQFMTVSGNCRKCRSPLGAIEIPAVEPTAVKIEVLQPAEIATLAAHIVKPRNREPKTKRPKKKKLAIAIDIPMGKPKGVKRLTAGGCYGEVRRARTAKERRDIIMRYLNG